MSLLTGRFKHQYQNFSLDVAFEIPSNGFTGIFGRSGAGKTSLLRCVAGLDRAHSGNLDIDDECWQDEDRNIFVPTHLRKVGFVSQDSALFPHLNVIENLKFGFERVAVTDRKLEFDEVINFLGVETLLSRKIQKLSGGEKKRVSIARALLTSPKILLLDEPLSALDSFSKDEIIPYLLSIKKRLRIPMLYISHDLPEMGKLCETVLLMEQGRITTVPKTYDESHP